MVESKKLRRDWSNLGLVLLIVFSLGPTGCIRAEEGYHVVETLQAMSPTSSGGFGGDLDMNEGLLIVGEWWADLDDIDSAGKAYIFDREWNLISQIQAPNPVKTDTFSRSVHVWGDTVVIGTTCNVGEIKEAGKVFIFNSEGELIRTIQSPNPEVRAHFGSDVCLHEDILVISEAHKNELGKNDIGLVHIYNSEGVLLQTLNTPSPKNYGAFGEFVDVNDDFIVVSEPGFVGHNPIDNGSVYVYNHDYQLVETLRSPDNQQRTFFGISVSLGQDYAVIGERWATVDGHEKAGRAHIYDTDWNLVATLHSPTPEDNGEFGLSVDIDGGIVVVGERKGDVVSMNEGKAYVFDIEGNLVDTLVSPDPQVGAQFGWRVLTDGVLIVVADVEYSIDDVNKAGQVHIFEWGKPAVEQPVTEEETTETESEPETETEKSGGIPGFPLESIAISIFLAVLALLLIQRQR